MKRGVGGVGGGGEPPRDDNRRRRTHHRGQRSAKNAQLRGAFAAVDVGDRSYGKTKYMASEMRAHTVLGVLIITKGCAMIHSVNVAGGISLVPGSRLGSTYGAV